MKIFRILFSIILLLIIVSIIAVTCLVFFIDPNKLKPIITEEVTRKTGYILVMDGKLSWSFYPRLSIKIDHMSLREPTAATPFIDLQDIKLATELSHVIHRNKKLQGDIYISEARLANLHAHNVSTTLHWEHDVLTLQPIKASLYDGTLDATVHGSQLSADPHWDWDAQFDRIQLKPLLDDLNGPDSRIKITGTGRVKFQATSQGKTRNQFFSHLNGSTDLNLDNGTVEGVDLNYLVQTADALINKQPVAAPANIKQTAFNSFTGTVTIKDGVANINNLLLLSPAIVTKGTGSINLVDQTINLQLQVKSQQAIKTQWEIPVLVSGNVTRPDVQLNMVEIEKWMASQQLDHLKEKASEQIKKHIPGKAGEFLQKLIGK